MKRSVTNRFLIMVSILGLFMISFVPNVCGELTNQMNDQNFSTDKERSALVNDLKAEGLTDEEIANKIIQQIKNSTTGKNYR